MDEPEFLRLFAQHTAQLQRHAFLLLGRWQDAEEVMQAASVVMWEKFDDFERGTSFAAWSKRIVYLQAMNHRRRQSKERVVFSDLTVELLATDDQPPPAGDQRDALQKCLDRLNPSDRQLIAARYAGNQQLKDYAERVGRQLESLYVSLNRIRSALRECMRLSENITMPKDA